MHRLFSNLFRTLGFARPPRVFVAGDDASTSASQPHHTQYWCAKWYGQCRWRECERLLSKFRMSCLKKLNRQAERASPRRCAWDCNWLLCYRPMRGCETLGVKFAFLEFLLNSRSIVDRGPHKRPSSIGCAPTPDPVTPSISFFFYYLPGNTFFRMSN